MALCRTSGQCAGRLRLRGAVLGDSAGDPGSVRLSAAGPDDVPGSKSPSRVACSSDLAVSSRSPDDVLPPPWSRDVLLASARSPDGVPVFPCSPDDVLPPLRLSDDVPVALPSSSVACSGDSVALPCSADDGFARPRSCGDVSGFWWAESSGFGSGVPGSVVGVVAPRACSVGSLVPDRGCPLPPLSSTVSPRSKHPPRQPGGGVSGRWYAAVATRSAPAPPRFPGRRGLAGRDRVTVSGGP